MLYVLLYDWNAVLYIAEIYNYIKHSPCLRTLSNVILGKLKWDGESQSPVCRGSGPLVQQRPPPSRARAVNNYHRQQTITTCSKQIPQAANNYQQQYTRSRAPGRNHKLELNYFGMDDLERRNVLIKELMNTDSRVHDRYSRCSVVRRWGTKFSAAASSSISTSTNTQMLKYTVTKTSCRSQRHMHRKQNIWINEEDRWLLDVR